MTFGRLIAVVGPSGVGKDSVMAGLVAADPSYKLVCRAITRAPELGGEVYDALSEEAFETAARNGAFCMHWHAHGLRYGLPISVLDEIAAGTNLLANFSRKALREAAQTVEQFHVLNITTHPETLAKRLATRGRETEDEIKERLAKADQPLPEGLNITHVANDGLLEDTVAEALKALQPARV